MGADDVYRQAEDLMIRLRLRADSANLWADKIGEAMASGSTGGEIFFGLRYVLTGLLEDERLLTETRSRAASLYDEISRALEPKTG